VAATLGDVVAGYGCRGRHGGGGTRRLSPLSKTVLNSTPTVIPIVTTVVA